jgi:predicted methyltransferase
MKLTALAHQRWVELLKPGAVAIDATVGNGHDTAALRTLVGPTGCVHGFDTQTVALERTRLLLGDSPNITLHRASHADLLKHLPAEHVGRVQLVVFNLGYLPSGDQQHTTQPDSTRAALQASATALAHSGWLSVLAYRGHPGGEEERAVVLDELTRWGWPMEVTDSGSVGKPGPTWILASREHERPEC